MLINSKLFIICFFSIIRFCKSEDLLELKVNNTSFNSLRVIWDIAIRIAVVRVLKRDVLTINVNALQISNTTSVPMNAELRF
jgi:hypothetical protein